MIDLLSWNVAARQRRFKDQVEAICKRRPDLLALQEVTPGLADRWTRELNEKSGLPWVETTLDDVERDGARGVLVASRWPLERLAIRTDDFPFPEKILGVFIDDAPGGPLELYTTHVPPGVSNGWAKIRHLNAVYQLLSVGSGGRRALCGDFNTPRAEWPNGKVITWAQNPSTGELNRRPGWRLMREGGDPEWDPEAWDEGERNVLEGLAEQDLTDVFRLLDRFPPGDKSWYWRGFGREVGRRFDHIFAAEQLRPREAGYLHEWREQGLSDHSAVWAHFEP
jgi:exonuclease III